MAKKKTNRKPATVFVGVFDYKYGSEVTVQPTLEAVCLWLCNKVVPDFGTNDCPLEDDDLEEILALYAAGNYAAAFELCNDAAISADADDEQWLVYHEVPAGGALPEPLSEKQVADIRALLAARAAEGFP